MCWSTQPTQQYVCLAEYLFAIIVETISGCYINNNEQLSPFMDTQLNHVSLSATNSSYHVKTEE